MQCFLLALGRETLDAPISSGRKRSGLPWARTGWTWIARSASAPMSLGAASRTWMV